MNIGTFVFLILGVLSTISFMLLMFRFIFNLMLDDFIKFTRDDRSYLPRVSYTVNKRNKETNKLEKIQGEGYFIEYGSEIVEDEQGFSSFSIAIVENDDGTVVTPCLENIKFLEKAGKNV